MMREKISHEKLLKVLEYRDDGNFYWKKTGSGRGNIKVPVGTKTRYGYVEINVFYTKIKAHTLVWFYHYKEFPKLYLDHINGIKTDNRLENLREATVSENAQNRIEHRNGNLIGASFNKNYKKFVAYAPRNFLNRKSEKQKYLGTFKTKKEAHEAVVKYCTENVT